MKHITIILAFLITLSSPIAAQDFQKGYDAAQAGDFATALQEWAPLAEAGDASAQINLGFMYINGRGVPQDYKEAVKWYKLAAEQGFANAQYNLAKMYENGKGAPQDYAEAVKWWRLAAEQGFADAQYNLGNMYRQGQGVPQDYKEAVKWYKLAAEQGLAQAQYNLGVMYDNGDGVLQNNTMAHMWYNIGAAHGYEPGGSNRDKVAKRMTQAAIETATTMARECMSSNFNGCVIRSEIPEHTNNEEEKSFFDQQNKMVNCSQPLPVFTLGLNSNPSSTEVTALCTCIWASFPVDGWERRTSEKLRNGEDSGWRGKALLSRFFSRLKECGGMKL